MFKGPVAACFPSLSLMPGSVPQIQPWSPYDTRTRFQMGLTELHVPRGGAESPADASDWVRGLVLSLSLAAGTGGCPHGGPDWPRTLGSGHPDETGQAWCWRGSTVGRSCCRRFRRKQPQNWSQTLSISGAAQQDHKAVWWSGTKTRQLYTGDRMIQTGRVQKRSHPKTEQATIAESFEGCS